MELTLTRNYMGGMGTFGRISHNGKLVCATVERPWLNNEPCVSCIPEGTYQLEQYDSPKFGPCYALVAEELGVTLYPPALRTGILIHPANHSDQLQGCIAPGTEYGVVNGRWAVISSRSAFNKLMDLLEHEDPLITITS